MKSIVIREKFFNFFTSRGHTLVASSSLIPADDPTLLFANAGMNQFKDVFLGKEKRNYTKAVSIQKCIRAGGKHNDLENVGFTRRHLTFFEMMGNFSFGDYFKKEAIRYAWEFLTETLNIPSEKLYASVYKLDDEAYEIWKNDRGLPPERIIRLGAADNFWQMGETGPCGPCSEIYFDRGAQAGCGLGSCAPGCCCDRFLEIWNLVFMQYDRQPDGTDKPLAQTGVDTGMGLERLCALIQNKESVFETDLFAPLIAHLEMHTGLTYTQSPEVQAAFRVLADHIRSSAFAIADGCTPSNEGRGYVLRKIIRRAALFGQKVGDIHCFAALVEPLVQLMGPLYPELIAQQDTIQNLIESEIERFEHNLTTGKSIFEKYVSECKVLQCKQLSGSAAFKLYDTFGFPLELTKLLAHDQGLTVDIAGFDSEMEKQRVQSGKKCPSQLIEANQALETAFVGYQKLDVVSTITGLVRDNNCMEAVQAGEECWVITQESPFFVECGGQISDTGQVTFLEHTVSVLALRKIGKAIACKILAPIDLQVGMDITLSVDEKNRLNTMKNHTATHLLQAALIELLGKQVRQSGSLVTPEYLRFDFTYDQNLTAEQIRWVEDQVNAKIMENIPVAVYTTDYQTAVAGGVIAIFGEKYNPECVRVIDIPEFSKELCGGTHVHATGDIGCFKITELSALSAGNRRVVAVTGPEAMRLFQESYALSKDLSKEFKVKPTDIQQALKKQQEQLKTCTSRMKDLKKKVWQLSKPEWLKRLTDIQGIPFLYLPVLDAAPEELRDVTQELLKTQEGLFVLTAPTPERTTVFITVSPRYAEQIDLQQILQWLKEQGLSGGGSKTALQASAAYIDQSFVSAFQEWLKRNIRSTR